MWTDLAEYFTDDGTYHNDYEVYRMGGAFGQSPPAPMTFDQRAQGPGEPRIYAGPGAPSGLADYPRIQLLSTGLLGEMITHKNFRRRESYSVREWIG